MFECYKDRSKKWRWRMKARNGKVIASSGESFANKRNCLTSVDRVKALATDAEVSIDE